jgi:hypothetical protein
MTILWDPPPDITFSHHRGNRESGDANRTVQPTKLDTRQQILDFITFRASRGATVDEIVAYFDSNHNHIAPRVSELKAMRLIQMSGERRKTRAGCYAAVLVPHRAHFAPPNSIGFGLFRTDPNEPQSLKS